MKRNFRRTTAVILSAALMFSSLESAVFAAEDSFLQGEPVITTAEGTVPDESAIPSDEVPSAETCRFPLM